MTLKPGVYTPEEALAALDAGRTATAAAFEDRIAALEAEVARLSQPESDADLIKRIERVWPTLQARNMRRAAMNLPGRSRPAYPS